MKRRVFIVMLALVLVVGLVACSSSNSSNGSSQHAGNDKSGDNPSGNKYTVSMFTGVWGNTPDPTQGTGLQKIDNKFNIDFKPQYVPMGQASQKMSVLMASGNFPDMVGLGGADANFFKWAKAGAFLPLNQYIDKYPVFKKIPQRIWKAVSFNGKIYGIPQYFPTKYGNTPIIRKDWLDKLGLKMPTNYDELLKVADAFTTQDPNGDDKQDTYGLVDSKGPDFWASMGSYWGGSWDHKNSKGQYIPGAISNASKQRIQFLHDAYQHGDMPKDWPVQTYKDARKLFWGGHAGIYYDSTPGHSTLFAELAQADPNAVVVPIYPFKSPNGHAAYNGLSGWYMMYALNAKLKSDPGKVDRILSTLNYMATFIPSKDQNPNNPRFDWKNGGVGKGYSYKNNTVNLLDSGINDRPIALLPFTPWAPNDSALDITSKATNPMMKKFAEASVKMWSTPGLTYLGMMNSIHSNLYNTKYWAIQPKLMDEQTKMIVGDEPISNWDKMVQNFLKSGGQQVIDDVNQKIKAAGVKPQFK